MEQTMPVQTTTRRATIGRMAVVVVALGGLSATAFATSAGAATKVVVSTTKNAKLGKILVSGKTLYTLKPSKTACTATCLKVWPALALPKGVKKATAGSGVSASKLGTKTIAGGVHQVTYGGKPLYWFSGDTGAGQVNGNVTDEWGKWTAVVTVKSGSGSTSTATTSGSGGTAF
jgi:predicted lipoprotein with Yx(FWY)xxD motif